MPKRPKAPPPPDGRPKAAAPMAAPGAPAVLFSGAFLFLFILALNFVVVHDTDAWFHLKMGEIICKTRAIPRVDIFSYTIAGTPWVAFEWLSQVVFYLLFSKLGVVGLTGFKALGFAGGFLLLWSLGLAAPAVSAGVLGLAALGMRLFFVERPFVFDDLLLCVLIRVLWRADFVDPPKRLRWALPALAAVWANLHGGAAFLVPALVGAAAAAERAADRRVPLRFWAGVAAASAAAVFVNPHGWRVLAHLRETVAFPSKGLIYEWHRPTSFQFAGIYGFYLAAGAWAVLAERRAKPAACALALATGAASLSAIRNIQLYLLCVSPLIVAAVRARWPKAGGGTWKAVFVCAALSLGAWFHTRHMRHDLRYRLGFGLEEQPEGALAFLDKAGVGGRMFNEYEMGGYLIWKGYPRRKVFIDLRNVEYGPGLLYDAMHWYQPAVWKKLDDRYHFDYALVRVRPEAYTVAVLDENPEWKLAYWDDRTLVYLRREPANEAVLRAHGYDLVRPGRQAYQYLSPIVRDSALRGRLLAELDRALAEAPNCGNALLLKADVLTFERRIPEAARLVERAVGLYPFKAQPRFTLGWLYEAAGDRARARRAYEEALRQVLDGEKPGVGADILNNLGSLVEREGDGGAAEKYYRNSLRWNPSQQNARRNLQRLTGF